MADPTSLWGPTCRQPGTGMESFKLPEVKSAGDLSKIDPSKQEAYEMGVPFLFDLNILESSEWSCAQEWMKTLPEATQKDLTQVVEDLKAANTDKSTDLDSRYVTNKEIATAFQDPKFKSRWQSPAQFRMAADTLLNILPNHLSQPKITKEDLGRVWSVLNKYAETIKGYWETKQTAQEDRQANIFGIDLTPFPFDIPDGLSKQARHEFIQTKAPDFIKRIMANEGNLTPTEYAAIHLLLKLETKDGSIVLNNGAPFSLPTEADQLVGFIARGGTFLGMPFVKGELTPEGNQACLAQLKDGILCETTPIQYIFQASPTAAEYDAFRAWMADSITSGEKADAAYRELLGDNFVGRNIGGMARQFLDHPFVTTMEFVGMIAAFKAAHSLVDYQIFKKSFAPMMQAQCGGDLTDAQMKTAWKEYLKRPYPNALAKWTLGTLNRFVPQILMFMFLATKKHEFLTEIGAPDFLTNNYFGSLATDLVMFVPFFEYLESLGRPGKQEFLASRGDLCPPKTEGTQVASEEPVTAPVTEPAAEPVAATDPALSALYGVIDASGPVSGQERSASAGELPAQAGISGIQTLMPLMPWIGEFLPQGLSAFKMSAFKLPVSSRPMAPRPFLARPVLVMP